MDECASCPCQNGATCLQSQLNMYKCQCMPGYTGVNCELPNDPCASQPCKNSAVCVLDTPNSFKCLCAIGFTGPLCDQIIDPCTSQNCVRNYTTLNINLYGLPTTFNFLSYQDCILKTWAYLNPSSKFIDHIHFLIAK